MIAVYISAIKVLKKIITEMTGKNMPLWCIKYSIIW